MAPRFSTSWRTSATIGAQDAIDIGQWWLSKLAYLMLWRSIQLLVLLARGNAAKDLELMVWRHQLGVLRRQVPRPKLEPAARALLAAISRVLP